MKNSNDVLTPVYNKAEVSKSVVEQMAKAESYHQEISSGKETPYVWANIDFKLSIGQDEGFCSGWIHYQDGRALHYFGKTTNTTGGPVQMRTNQLIPTKVLPYEQLRNDLSHFNAKGNGMGSGGQLELTVGKSLVPISPIPWDLFGTALVVWSAKGNGKFNPA